MFKENTVITLLVAQDRVPDTNEQLTPLQAGNAIATLQSDDRIDVVVVASDNEAILALAHERDAVNRSLSGPEVNDHIQILIDVIDGADSFVDETQWILLVSPIANLPEMVEAAFATLVSNPNATAVTVRDDSGAKVEFLQAGAFAAAKQLPLPGAVSVLV